MKKPRKDLVYVQGDRVHQLFHDQSFKVIDEVPAEAEADKFKILTIPIVLQPMPIHRKNGSR